MKRSLLLLAALLGCPSAGSADARDVGSPAPPETSGAALPGPAASPPASVDRASTAVAYPDLRARVTDRQQALAGRWARARTANVRRRVLDEARAAIFQAITGELLPAWEGTTWAFHGTTETPRQGEIACGYLVSTVLRDAGFRVPRVKLAQQASEIIIRSLVPERAIRRFSDRPVEEVVASVQAQGDGLYLVGLDYHVGFLVVEGAEVSFCHSSYLPPGRAVCEPARPAHAMASRYHVTGRLLDDALIRAWLTRRPLPVTTRGR